MHKTSRVCSHDSDDSDRTQIELHQNFIHQRAALSRVSHPHAGTRHSSTSRVKMQKMVPVPSNYLVFTTNLRGNTLAPDHASRPGPVPPPRVRLIIVQHNYCIPRQKPKLTNFERLGTFFVILDNKWPIWLFVFEVFRISEIFHTKFGD